MVRLFSCVPMVSYVFRLVLSSKKKENVGLVMMILSSFLALFTRGKKSLVVVRARSFFFWSGRGRRWRRSPRRRRRSTS